MKKYILIICLLFYVPVSFSQFNTLIFKKYLSVPMGGIVALGDQNNDGYDDFAVYDCNLNTISVFYGGNPMDTIPRITIPISNVNFNTYILAMDINNDGKMDIVLSYLDISYKTHINIYFGGPNINMVPDLTFGRPAGSSISFRALFEMKNFDGSGRGTLMIYDPYSSANPYNQVGYFYLYKTYPQFDTIPFKILKGDSSTGRSLFSNNLTTGDLDGDGLTDIAITGNYMPGYQNEFLDIFKGNPSWNLTPFVTYYKNQHSFDTYWIRIVSDINKDNKDDILMLSYGSFFPYWYVDFICYGSLPIDTIPDVGLNTQNQAAQLIVSPGDVNGDGYNDLLLSCTYGFGTRNARLWLGGSHMYELPRQYYGGSMDGYGKFVAVVGDVNGDGLADICVGANSDQGDCIPGYINIFKGDTLYRELPVEFTKFTASVQGRDVTLNWQTATEINNIRFDVLRSEGTGRDWVTIGSVEGNGTTVTLHNYSYTDKNIKNNQKYYYKLKQVDSDGSFKYSDETEVNFQNLFGGYSLSQNFPNPFNPSTTIRYTVTGEGKVKVTLKIYNVLGTGIAILVDEDRMPGEYEVNFDAGKYNLPSGMYFYRITMGNFQTVKKMSLIK